VICSIGNFPFEAHDLTGLNEQTQAHFGEYKPYGSNPRYHNTQGSTKTITLAGSYIASPNSKPKQIEAILRAKSPVRFTMATGESAMVVVTGLDTSRKNFISRSGAVNIDFTVTMTQVGTGGMGGLSLLAMIIGALFALF